MTGTASPNKRPRVVPLDANVFFGPPLRDLFMHLHEVGVLNVHWTRESKSDGNGRLPRVKP